MMFLFAIQDLNFLRCFAMSFQIFSKDQCRFASMIVLIDLRGIGQTIERLSSDMHESPVMPHYIEFMMHERSYIMSHKRIKHSVMLERPFQRPRLSCG